MSKQDWVTTAPRTDKPWGHESLFALVDGKYCGKAIHVSEGHALSLQYHEQKEETISVFSGRLKVEVGEHESALEEFELEPGGITVLTCPLGRTGPRAAPRRPAAWSRPRA